MKMRGGQRDGFSRGKPDKTRAQRRVRLSLLEYTNHILIKISNICIYINTYIYIHIHTYIYMYIYTYIYVCI